ncbi:MAG: ABC transporter substrate-binding protein [Beijerinckiaceae bacterium]|nr:ABC transporter substrate-binding protein [Beijerinckiaceae bacterium]
MVRYLAKACFALLALSVVGVASSAMAAPRTDLNAGIRLEPPHLDPSAGAAAAIGEIVYANLFEGLTRMAPDGAIVPGLAESWTVSADGKTYTFTLRKGVTFHDGAPFDANVAKFTLDRARAADSVNPQKGLFEPIDAVEVVDPATLKVTLKRPTGAFLFNLAWPAAVMVSPQSAADNKTKPVGTGPFKFERWAKGSQIDLVRNPTYWGKTPALNKISFKIIGDPAAAYAAMMAGDLDAYPIFPANENIPQFQKDPRFTVKIGNTEGKTIVALNNARKPFDDIRVRRALAYGIDRKAVIEGATMGLAKPIGSHYAPQDAGYVDLTGKYPYDPEKAKALLKEAGVSNLKAKLVLPPPDYARRGGEIVAAQLKKIGVDVELVPVEWAQWLSDVFRGKNYDMTIISHVEPMDLDIYARDDYYFNYNNPDYKALYTELAATSDPDKRKALIAKAQEKLADDSVNVFMFLLPKTGVWNAKLDGLWENAPLPVNDFTAVRWRD